MTEQEQVLWDIKRDYVDSLDEDTRRLLAAATDMTDSMEGDLAMLKVVTQLAFRSYTNRAGAMSTTKQQKDLADIFLKAVKTSMDGQKLLVEMLEKTRGDRDDMLSPVLVDFQVVEMDPEERQRRMSLTGLQEDGTIRTAEAEEVLSFE